MTSFSLLFSIGYAKYGLISLTKYGTISYKHPWSFKGQARAAIVTLCFVLAIQAKVLQQEVRKRSNLGGLNKEGKQSAAMIAWSRVERNLRAALRRNPSSPMVLQLEVGSLSILLRVESVKTSPLVLSIYYSNAKF